MSGVRAWLSLILGAISALAGAAMVVGPTAAIQLLILGLAALVSGLAGLTVAIQGLAGVDRRAWQLGHWAMLVGLALSTAGTALGALTVVVRGLVAGGL